MKNGILGALFGMIIGMVVTGITFATMNSEERESYFNWLNR